MSFKLTAVLLILLAAVGSYAYFFGKPPPPPKKETEFTYDVELSDVFHIDVRHKDKRLVLDWNDGESKWYFQDKGMGEVDQGRLNGLRLLLTGPGTKRTLFRERVADLSDYGLDNPETVTTVKLKDGAVHVLLMGHRTPDDGSYYIKNQNEEAVYLVDAAWGNEIIRFVNEPPITKDVQDLSVPSS